jgi:phage protein U
MAGTPMIDDIELKAVQWLRQETNQGFVRQSVAGLEGTLHQKLGRRSHRVVLSGVLLPDTATDDLKNLQEKAAAGGEVTFTADITTALSIQKMVIESFIAEQQPGRPGQFAYAIALAESPPLPPPAEVSAFGGLDDFGLGDMGFDVDALGGVLGDIADQAGALMDAVDSAMDVVQKLEGLANLANLADIGNPMKPLSDKVGELSSLAAPVKGLSDSIKKLLNPDG